MKKEETALHRTQYNMFKKNNKANGKYDGLSEPQRLQMRQFEQKQLESKARFEEVLPKFRDAYNKLVKEFGCVHVGAIRVDRFRGIVPDIDIMDCYRQVQAQEEAEKGRAVMPEDKPEVVV